MFAPEIVYLVICKDQVSSLRIGFEGEPLRGCVNYLDFRDNRNNLLICLIQFLQSKVKKKERTFAFFIDSPRLRQVGCNA